MKNTRLFQIVLLVGLGLAILFIPLSNGSAAPVERTFYIEASRFQYSQPVLKVNPGDKVTIILSTSDVMHGLLIEGYNVETMTQPTRKGTITFVADKSGAFKFHCTVVCGNMHPFMTGKLVVGQNTFLMRSIALLGLVMIAGAWVMRK